MKKLGIIILAVILEGFGVSGGSAATINLFDYGFNIDGGLTYPGDPLPGSVDASGFDFTTGLGTLTLTLSGVGAHNVVFFVDHEIDEATNTFFNEYGSANGTLAAGQTWEIDEPGFVFGDIYDNFLNSTLDNTNGVPMVFADDVSMALGWDFSLAAGQTALINFILSDSVIPSRFYLTHTDPDSNNASIYFSSTNSAVPEPATILLISTGLVGLAGLHRRRLKG